MSEVENSTTTDIDNNVQETPKSTPRKRLSRAEKARIESEELLKALGVTMEAGRQTRSSRRGTNTVETPKSEPAKRKQPSTPRTAKKPKVFDIDQIDSTNHVEEGNNADAQIAEAPIAASSASAKIVQNDADEKPAASQSVSNNGKKMEVDDPMECTQSDERTLPEEITQAKIVPQPEIIEDSPIDDEPPIEEDSLPITSEDAQPSTAVEVTEIFDDENVSASADTTAPLVVDTEPIVISPPLSDFESKDEPIELQSSPSDTDETAVTNSQVVPDAIVDLESSSSNEGDAKNEAANNSQEANSLDLEVINSDSSLGDEPQASSTEEKPKPTSTSTAEVTVTETNDTVPVAKTNDISDNSVHSSEPPQNSVGSTNQKSSPDNFRTTITSVDTPIEETITTTSEKLVQPNATTA
ncbi:transforming acidic coiled-coil-containing protein 2-like [Contarinia nasturtii]|uniref:transforming acidic coiled-coil-containing protein 2-like n=1 Tax=Contarinia nasturtii TaxID=265458 RepID=UPI0012D44B1D|nr:transforming acidic coiled-coil-containing protein 2-like [Contarinia nasturtii]